MPAPVKIIQNVTVGPTLGPGLHRQGHPGRRSSGLAWSSFSWPFTMAFPALIADWALVLNIIYLMGALSSMRATLTLPGIAGIILAIGMAVDSNVLMFERIREELRLGKTIRAAVDSGYDKASVHHHRLPRDHPDYGGGPLPVWHGTHQGLCRHPQSGRGHQPLFGPDRNQSHLRLDQSQEAAKDPEHLRKGRNP